MSFRLFGSLLVLCLPTLALAQTAPTITITPKAGAGAQTIFSQAECEDSLDADIDLYDVKVDFGLAAPAVGTTLTVKLGEKCTDETDCLTILDAETLSLAVTTETITLNTADLIGIIGETDCLSSGGAGIDQQYTLFVEVEDAAGTTTKEETDEDEDLFLDTTKPLAPLTPKASGGENNLNVSWATNPDNDNTAFPLEQEANFLINCKLAGAPDTDFTECGGAAAGIFQDTVDKLNGVSLENGTSIDVQVITIDLAGNESAPTATFTGTPQDVLDFGENFNGSEQGGCAVGHGEGQLIWVGFLIVVISLLRRNKHEAKL